MRLQASTDYAVRILQYLHAVEGQEGELQTATDISNATGVTYPFFIKIANQLKKKGLLDSVQGRHGGYILGKSGEEISLYDVIRAVEGEVEIHGCLRTPPTCSMGDPSGCSMHVFFRGMQDKLIAELSGKSIADLVVASSELENRAS